MARKKNPPPPNVDAILAAFNGDPLPPVPAPPPEKTAAIPLALVQQLKAIQNEQLSREFEALKLWEPLGPQDAFLRSTAKTRIYRGGNRAGKTTVGAVETALAMTGKRGLHGFYPAENVMMMVVAWDMRDTGLVIYRALCQEGHFRVIYDPEEKRTRAFRPWMPWDQAYAEKSKPAPPLIPPRMIADKAWHSAAEAQPSMIRFVTGSELLFFSSLGEPRKGLKLHGAWIDEEMQGQRWLPEIYMRLVDLAGLLFWTATPQNGTPELLDLLERCDQEQEIARQDAEDRRKREEFGIKNRNPPYKINFESFLMSQRDNPHLNPEGRAHAEESLLLGDAEDVDVRIDGDTVSQGFLVFPEFSERGSHSMDPIDPLPDSWTRYLILDPGRACASILFAVPPSEDPIHGGHIYGAQSIFIARSDAEQWADRARHWYETGVIERHFIDMHFGGQTRSGGEREVEYYEREMKKRGMSSRQTEFRLEEVPGDRTAGIEAVRSWLRRNPKDGLPKFRIMYRPKDGAHFADFVRQMKRFSYGKDPKTGHPTNTPTFKNCDMVDCLRYAAMLELRWVPPSDRHVVKFNDYASKLADKMRSEMGTRQGQLAGSICLGPQGLWKG
jgi:hypothetical protein